MKKTIILVLAMVFSTAPVLASATDRTHQERDFEVKKRIYGIRYPWEIVEPYPHVNGPTMDVLDRSKQPQVIPKLKPSFPFDKPLTPTGIIPFA